MEHTDMMLIENLKQLRLPTMTAEFKKLAAEAASENAAYEQYLLKLAEAEVCIRSAKAESRRIRQAGFAALKGLDTFDFSALPSLNKQRVLELSRGEWIGQNYNCALIGSSGTGKTHLAIALGLAACRCGKRVRFFSASALVNRLEEAQKEYKLERLNALLEKADLLIVDELGYVGFSRTGGELLFRVFAERYERASILVTSNLSFADWVGVFRDERLTAALLDRFTHRCHIFEMNGESYRFKESAKRKKK